MTRLRRSRLAGALVALGIVVMPRIASRLLVQRAVINFRSFRPRALISPTEAGQMERRFVSGESRGKPEIRNRFPGSSRCQAPPPANVKIPSGRRNTRGLRSITRRDRLDGKDR